MSDQNNNDNENNINENENGENNINENNINENNINENNINENNINENNNNEIENDETKVNNENNNDENENGEIEINQDVNNIILKKPPTIAYQEPSKTTSYSIPIGTPIFYASKEIKTFDTTTIKFDKNHFTAFFTTDKNHAIQLIQGCSSSGYVHEFDVIRDINNIIVVSAYDQQLNWTIDGVNNEYCNNKNLALKPNGVGYFIKKQNENNEPIIYFYFAICNPSDFLKYIGTYNCVSLDNLSDYQVSFETNKIVID